MHLVLACMVLNGLTGKYGELRDAYNSVIDDDNVRRPKVPPMEEWRGITSICDHMFCRWAVFCFRVLGVQSVIAPRGAICFSCGGFFKAIAPPAVVYKIDTHPKLSVQTGWAGWVLVSHTDASTFLMFACFEHNHVDSICGGGSQPLPRHPN